MALKDGEMHVLSMFGAALFSAAFFVPILWLTEAAEAEGPAIKEVEVIEATLAYRKTPQKQPQKLQETQKTEKPEGVSRDENKKVEPKEEKKAEKKEEKSLFGAHTRPSEDDGKPTLRPDGDFNGSEKGFAPTSKGDPFFGRLRADMNFQFPEIAKAKSIPIGCIKLLPDGKIDGIKFDEKGDDDLQTAAEASLKELQKIRSKTPEAVPTHLLNITRQWLCFKFSVTSE